jgi:hypothetical protein
MVPCHLSLSLSLYLYLSHTFVKRGVKNIERKRRERRGGRCIKIEREREREIKYKCKKGKRCM